jgi:hypothetical protein
VAVGNLKPIKGHRYLVEAAALLQAHTPNTTSPWWAKARAPGTAPDGKRKGLEKTFHFPGKPSMCVPGCTRRPCLWRRRSARGCPTPCSRRWPAACPPC